MTKKLKYTLFGTGFLGANAIVFLALRNTLQSFDPLKGFWAIWSSGRETHSNDYKLKLEAKENSSQLDLKGGLNGLKGVTLDIDRGKGGLDSISPFLNDSADQNYAGSIKNIFDEMLKEIQTKKIEKKMDSKYEELAKKYLEEGGKDRHTMLVHFQKAESSIKKWLENKSKPDHKAPAKSLSPEERISLQKFYELHYELSGKGKGFSNELQEVSGVTGGGGSSPATNDSVTNLQNVKKSLRVIGWDRSKIKVQPTVSTKFFSSGAWGPWSNNPYKTFYGSEEEFKKHLSAMNSSSLQISKLEQSISRERGMWGSIPRANAHFQAQERQAKELKANQSSEIEYHIGSKLLEFMSR
ncbi:hypothetical protein DNK47_02780 [Mycoplasma wenyonii]|uniref:Uncharacterized protein n=1 Tax=Mycoplasma wenyonii TaxID=65123 RepID=A0A328PPC4_9MOLU|nr:hypothetical protein [Mycoplasma wenyonii]RAO94868.1 hypothetical protein DNK47_02780 [Mycoplasma wenyonii]